MKTFDYRVFSLSSMLALQDVKQAYRRSAVGPFWITASMAVQIASMGVVFGLIFKTPLHEYLPFLASSVILFGLLSSVMIEGCLAFISAEAMIKQLQLPLFSHVFRVVFRNLINFSHHIILVPIVFLVLGQSFKWQAFMFLPGLCLVILNATWIVFVLGAVSARFRDLPQITSSAMTIIYFVTPVMWQPSLVPPETAHLLLGFNPFYHLLQLLRLPLLGEMPTPENWLVVTLMAFFGWVTVGLLLKRFGRQIPYWV